MLFEAGERSRKHKWGVHEAQGRITDHGDWFGWQGGSLGWHNSSTSLEEEGRQPLRPVPAPEGAGHWRPRLVQCWNACMGLSIGTIHDVGFSEDSKASVTRVLVDLDWTMAPDLGAQEARKLQLQLRSMVSSIPRMTSMDVSQNVSSKGHNFSHALAWEDGGIVTEQTFLPVDAERMAVCWNSLATLPKPSVFSDAVMLLVRSAGEIRSLLDMKVDRDCLTLMEVGAIVDTGYRLFQDLSQSPSYHVSPSGHAFLASCRKAMDTPEDAPTRSRGR